MLRTTSSRRNSPASVSVSPMPAVTPASWPASIHDQPTIDRGSFARARRTLRGITRRGRASGHEGLDDQLNHERLAVRNVSGPQSHLALVARADTLLLADESMGPRSAAR